MAETCSLAQERHARCHKAYIGEAGRNHVLEFLHRRSVCNYSGAHLEWLPRLERRRIRMDQGLSNKPIELPHIHRRHAAVPWQAIQKTTHCFHLSGGQQLDIVSQLTQEAIREFLGRFATFLESVPGSLGPDSGSVRRYSSTYGTELLCESRPLRTQPAWSVLSLVYDHPTWQDGQISDFLRFLKQHSDALPAEIVGMETPTVAVLGETCLTHFDWQEADLEIMLLPDLPASVGYLLPSRCFRVRHMQRQPFELERDYDIRENNEQHGLVVSAYFQFELTEPCQLVKLESLSKSDRPGEDLGVQNTLAQ